MKINAHMLREVKRERARRSLYGFVQVFWHVVEPGSAFQDNWHIRVLCDALEQAWPKRETPQLVINMPPRHGKSILVSVMWPVWLWTQDPSLRFLFASYAASLSLRDGGKCLQLIQSPLFQELFPEWGGFPLRGRTASKILTAASGHRIATSVGGATTGEGGDIIVMDDLLNALEAFSDVERNKANLWMDQALSTRVNDPNRFARVMVCQRLHEDDPAGHVLREGGWRLLCLRARRERDDFPYDPRKPGELLWPERFGPDQLASLELKLGSYGVAGQLQQRPAPLEGGLLNRTWFKHWKALPTPHRVVISVDAAFKDGPNSSYVVVQVWITNGADRYLVHQVREHMDIVKTIDTIRSVYAWATGKFRMVSATLIEDKANGPAVISMLRRKLPGIVPIEPAGSKESRAAAISPQLEAGNIHVPADAPWVEDFLHECETFPNAQHDDQVDAMTQAVRYVTEQDGVMYGGTIPNMTQTNRWALAQDSEEE